MSPRGSNKYQPHLWAMFTHTTIQYKILTDFHSHLTLPCLLQTVLLSSSYTVIWLGTSLKRCLSDADGSILHTASYCTKNVSEAESLACLILLLCSDCIYFVIFAWFLCFYHGFAGYVLEWFLFLSVLTRSSQTRFRVSTILEIDCIF